jgi:hypothetical protein
VGVVYQPTVATFLRTLRFCAKADCKRKRQKVTSSKMLKSNTAQIAYIIVALGLAIGLCLGLVSVFVAHWPWFALGYVIYSLAA